MQAAQGECLDAPTGNDTSSLMDWAHVVARSYRWTRHRGLDFLAPGTESRAFAADFRAAVADSATTILVEPAGDLPRAATAVRPKPMETRCFGLRTAAVSEVISPADAPWRRGLVQRLLQRLTTEVAGEQDLLILRVDVDDVDTLSAAQAVGFTVHECTLTYLVDSSLQPPTNREPTCDIEVHEGDVRGAISGEEADLLARTSAEWDLNHFRADRRIPAERVRAYYEEWIHNIASGAWSDCTLVARREGRVVGLKSETTDDVVSEACGATFRVGGFMVVPERGSGTGQALVDAAAQHRPPAGRYRSWDTQARNLPAIRCFERCGLARPIRASYTLHAWPTRT